MNVDTVECDSNQSSRLPDHSVTRPTVNPHHEAASTPSPDTIIKMAPSREAIVMPRAVSLSPTLQSDATESSASSTMSAAQKSDSDELDVTNDESEEEEEEPSLRRSKREKKSTLVYIDGHAVLAKNNYQVKGLSYHYGTDFETAPPSKPKLEPAAKSKAPSKPRAVTQQETKRLQHNAAIKERIDKKKERRIQFLASNLTTMEPFLDKHVVEKLKAVTNTVTKDSHEIFLQPDAIRADMRDYQLAGLNWMVKMHESNLGMVLGDEMGLGKTLQTISLLCHLKERDGVSGPSLVICPLSVLYSWCNELEKWAPSLKFLRFHSSSPDERESQKQAFQEKATEFDVVVTTYEMAKTPGLRSLWSRQNFNYLILDEGHRIKDANSQISQAVRLIHYENALILTGTPLQNNLIELWSLLNFLHPDVFVTNERFAEAFDLTENVINKEKLLEAHSLLGLFMLRRLKTEVEKLMPKKVETKVICPLSSTQIYWYKALLMKDINLLARTSGDENQTSAASAKCLSNLVMQLRKCCLHPFLFEGAEVHIEETTCEELIAASGKLSVLDILLRSLYKKKHRVVLFSQFTSVLDILQDYCTMRGFKHCRFDGSTPRAKRNFIVNQFNAEGSDYFIFLMSTRSGGMGLNLQSADTCILYDSDWNPQPDIQAMARVHRIGQTKTVHVYRLVCGGTIEERMVERAQKKLYLDQMVNQDSVARIESDEDPGDISKGELLKTLKFGCDAVFGEDNENKNTLPTEEDIDVITDRNRSETFSDGRLKGGTNDKASDFHAEGEFTSTTNLRGIDFKEIRDQYKKKKTKDIPKDIGGIADTWIKFQKRNRKSRIVNLSGAGSGYGSKSVPVLAANNYDLENGESSVFQRELGGVKGNFGEMKRKVKVSGVDFESQDICQVCGDGGLILCCPRCPVCVHAQCVGIDDPKNFLSCPHHRCSKCNKNATDAGGLLFPCQSCPLSFCEDCLPAEEKGFRLLTNCDRFTELGYDSSNFCYIHCSERCEEYAKQEFNWSEQSKERPPVPAALDLTNAFGSQIDATIDDIASEEICESRLRKRKVQNYKGMDTVDDSMTQVPRQSSAKQKDEDPEFVVDKNNEGSSDSDEDQLPVQKKVLKLPKPLRTFPQPDDECYDVVFPCTPHGYLFVIESRNGKAVFSRYLKTPEGLKGPAEVANRVRGAGDRVMAVNRVDVSSYTFAQVIDLLRCLRASQSHIIVSFRRETCMKPLVTMPKYNHSNVTDCVGIVGTAAPNAPLSEEPRQDTAGLRAAIPVGNGLSAKSCDDFKGDQVATGPATSSSLERRKKSPPEVASSDKENARASSVNSLGVSLAGNTPKVTIQQSTAENRGKKPAGLKRKSEDVIDLTLSDDDRPTKRASKLKDLPRPTEQVISPSLAEGEYEISLPVTKYGLLLEVANHGERTLVYGYRRAPDGTKGQAELNSLIREAGDRIVGVEQTDVSSLKYKEVIDFIVSKQKNASSITLRLRGAKYGSAPPALPTVNQTSRRKLPNNNPSTNEYDVAIPMTSGGLMIRVGDLDGAPVFLEYRRFPDGQKGPAELNKVIRNVGDKIVAVDGIEVNSYHHLLAEIQESKNNPVTYLRLQENHEKIPF